MPRSVPEWIGANDNTAIPPRVKVRIFERDEGKCCVCGLSILGRLVPAYDHIVALVNGGQNRETNLRLLCSQCHRTKSRDDVQEKAVVYRKKLAHLGLKNKRKLPGSKGSGFRKRMDGTVWRER